MASILVALPAVNVTKYARGVNVTACGTSTRNVARRANVAARRASAHDPPAGGNIARRSAFAGDIPADRNAALAAGASADRIALNNDGRRAVHARRITLDTETNIPLGRILGLQYRSAAENYAADHVVVFPRQIDTIVTTALALAGEQRVDGTVRPAISPASLVA